MVGLGIFSLISVSIFVLPLPVKVPLYFAYEVCYNN